MQKLEPFIKNKSNEKLDTWVEIPDGKVKATVIMVHGFGTNKHETAVYFDDVSTSLVDNNFRVVRFDFSGYGKSEGKQEDACYSKHIVDLHTIIDHIKSNYPDPIHIFSQSMGCFVTALASPSNIAKTIMTGLPNADTQMIIDRVVERFGTRPGAKLDLGGVSLLPRSTGKIQKIGAQFWRDIKDLDPTKITSDYSKKTELLVVHWDNDEIIGKESLEQYDAIPSVKALWLPGNHSVTDPADRQNFIKIMLDFYNK